MKLRILCLASLLAFPASGEALRAQQVQDTVMVPVAVPAAPVADSIPGGISPTGAFLRSVVLPGWGHAAIGSHMRGAFYVAAEGGTAWMLLRIHSRLRSANRQLDLRLEEARAYLIADGLTEEADILEALDSDETLDSPRNLLSSRQQQREDWLAFGIFLMLLSGADALVSAHLQDFPATPDFGLLPNGRVEVGLSIQLGN